MEVVTTRVNNPFLPAIGGVPGVLFRVAQFAGVEMGQRLRRARAIQPTLEAVVWADHDDDGESSDDEPDFSDQEEDGGGEEEGEEEEASL